MVIQKLLFGTMIFSTISLIENDFTKIVDGDLLIFSLTFL